MRKRSEIPPDKAFADRAELLSARGEAVRALDRQVLSGLRLFVGLLLVAVCAGGWAFLCSGVYALTETGELSSQDRVLVPVVLLATALATGFAGFGLVRGLSRHARRQRELRAWTALDRAPGARALPDGRIPPAFATAWDLARGGARRGEPAGEAALWRTHVRRRHRPWLVAGYVLLALGLLFAGASWGAGADDAAERLFLAAASLGAAAVLLGAGGAAVVQGHRYGRWQAAERRARETELARWQQRAWEEALPSLPPVPLSPAAVAAAGSDTATAADHRRRRLLDHLAAAEQGPDPDAPQHYTRFHPLVTLALTLVICVGATMYYRGGLSAGAAELQTRAAFGGALWAAAMILFVIPTGIRHSARRRRIVSAAGDVAADFPGAEIAVPARIDGVRGLLVLEHGALRLYVPGSAAPAAEISLAEVYVMAQAPRVAALWHLPLIDVLSTSGEWRELQPVTDAAVLDSCAEAGARVVRTVNDAPAPLRW
jgi:hypothetical protein